MNITESFSNLILYHVLPESGLPITAGTVQKVTETEKQTETNKERIETFSKKLAEKFKKDRLATAGTKPDLKNWTDLLENDKNFAAEFNRLYNNSNVPETDNDFDPDFHNIYLNIELFIDRDSAYPKFAKITKRIKNHRNNFIGTAHNNPIMDTRIYKIEYYNSSKQTLAANIITENLFACIDEKEYRHLLLNVILNIRTIKKTVEKKIFSLY